MIQNKENFKRIIDRELDHIKTENIDLNKIFEGKISIKQRIKNLLDKELEIPVGVFAFTLCISLTVTVMFNFAKINISESEIMNSKIKILEMKGGSI